MHIIYVCFRPVCISRNILPPGTIGIRIASQPREMETDHHRLVFSEHVAGLVIGDIDMQQGGSLGTGAASSSHMMCHTATYLTSSTYCLCILIILFKRLHVLADVARPLQSMSYSDPRDSNNHDTAHHPPKTCQLSGAESVMDLALRLL